MESLRMMGWGLMLAENSSVAVAVAVAAAVLRVGTHGVMVVVGYDYSTRLRLLYKATTTLQGYDYSTRLRLLYKALPRGGWLCPEGVGFAQMGWLCPEGLALPRGVLGEGYPDFQIFVFF